MLRSNLFDFNYVYIVEKVRITVEGANNASRRNKNLTFNNNASFRSCISKSITH